MKEIKKLFVLVIIFSFLNINLFSKKNKLPKQLKEAFAKTETGEVIKSGMELNFSTIRFFPAQGEKTNVIVSFKFKELEQKEEEKTEKAENDVLAVEVINKKEPKKKVTVFAPIENSGENSNDYYYFEIQAKPGEYEIVGIVSTRNLKKMGSHKIDVKVPDMFPNKVSLSSLLLYKGLKKLEEPPIGFKIYKNSFPMGMYMVYPIEGNVVSAGVSPRLLYFINGLKKNKLSRQFQVKISYKLLKDGKEVEKFKPVVINNNVVDQPLPLIAKGEKLSGKYKFEVEVMDIVSRDKVKDFVDLEYK